MDGMSVGDSKSDGRGDDCASELMAWHGFFVQGTICTAGSASPASRPMFVSPPRSPLPLA